MGPTTATPGPPHGALLARGRTGAHTSGQNSTQGMYCGRGRGGAANGPALRTLRVDDLQVACPGGDFGPIGAAVRLQRRVDQAGVNDATDTANRRAGEVL